MPPLTEDELNQALEDQYNDDAVDEDFGDDFGEESTTIPEEEVRDPGVDKPTEDEPAKDESSEQEATDRDESTQESDDAEDSDEDDSEKEERKPIMIPKRRLDSVIARAKRAEAELEALKAQKQENPQSEVDWDARMDEATRKFSEALADGDTEAAAQANKELMQIQQEQFNEKLNDTSSSTLNVSRDAALTDEIVDEVIMNNAEFQIESDKFDQKLVDDIEELRSLYESQGHSKSQALIRALEMRAPNALAPAPETKPSPKKRTTNIERNIEAAESQAPDTRHIAEDSDRYGMQDAIPDIYKLTDDELDALPESTWNRLLGNEY